VTRSGWVWFVTFGYGEAVEVRSDRSCCVALRYVLAVEVRSVVLRQVEVWVGSVTAVGARSGLDGEGELGRGGRGPVRYVWAWRVTARRSGSF
jgi:hypothetical protein